MEVLVYSLETLQNIELLLSRQNNAVPPTISYQGCWPILPCIDPAFATPDPRLHGACNAPTPGFGDPLYHVALVVLARVRLWQFAGGHAEYVRSCYVADRDAEALHLAYEGRAAALPEQG